MPSLEDYVTNQKFDFNLKGVSRRLKAGDIPKLVDDAMAPINADDAINKTFQYFVLLLFLSLKYFQTNVLMLRISIR